jgi:hypothetical protein
MAYIVQEYSAIKLDISTVIACSLMIIQGSKNLESGGNNVRAARIHNTVLRLKLTIFKSQ